MRLVVFNELRSGTCILGCRFHLDGSSEGSIFSGLEGARLWLRKPRMAFVSWGAVFIWLGLRRSKVGIFQV